MIFYLVPVAVLVIFILLKLYPANKTPYADSVQMSRKARKFDTYEVITIFPWFIFMGIIGFGIYKLGNPLSELYHSYVHQGQLYYIAPLIFWMLPIGLLSFGLGIIPLELLLMLLLGREYEVYLAYTNKKHGYDGMKIVKPIFKSLTVLGVLSILLVLNNYMIIGKKQFIENELFALNDKTINWTDINQVIHYDSFINSDGEEIDRETIALYQEGKELFVIKPMLFNDNKEEMDKFVQIVLERTQVSMEKMDVYR